MRRLLVLVMAALLTAAATVGPASAGDMPTHSHQDPRNDAQFGINLERTTLWARTRPGYVVAQLDGFEFTRNRLNGAVLFLDTRSSNAGPEYRIWWDAPNDGDGLAGKSVSRVDTWSGPGRHARCPELKVRYSLAHDFIAYLIPRRCIKTQGKIRYSTQTWNFTRYDNDGYPTWGYYDAAPSRTRMFGPWIGRSGTSGTRSGVGSVPQHATR